MENEMEFVIQHNLMNENQLKLTKEAVEKYPHRFVGLIPFSREITSDEPLVGTDFIPYGSTLFTTLAYDMKWKGLHFDLSKFNYETSLEHRSDMLNDNVDTIEAHLDALCYQDPEMELFIRPSEDLKQFSGQVMKAGEIYDWLKDAVSCASSGSYKLEMDTKVVICQPENIQAEWRWFVVGGKVVDGSMYRAHGQLIKQHTTCTETIIEAQTFADKWLPDPCCCMDLALVNGELKVIEFNCINSSGFYNHNVSKIFDALWEYHQ